MADDSVRMERLWAPWRLEYVAAPDRSPAAEATPLELLPGADPECFLCRAVASPADRENLVVDRHGPTICVLNRFPYNNGHLLVAPRAHHGRLEQLAAEEHLALVDSIRRMTATLERLMNPDGFNVGLNLGRAAGAGVPGHLHWHIVPRWNGDVNFMATVAGTRVIPQSLQAAWEMLTEALA